jgi:AhpD family alkylhydroperoxidase
MEFRLHDTRSAPEDSRLLLENAQKSMGFIPNLYGHLAAAPSALKAYLELSRLFESSSLSPVEQQAVLLAASVENRCEFCVAAHSMLAEKAAGASRELVQALRSSGTVQDTRLSALVGFTREVVAGRGWVAGEAMERFAAAGYGPQQAIEVVLGVSLKTLSNYVNHLAGTRTNRELADYAWQAP